MCGVAGFIDFSGKSGREEIIKMTQILRHRGPDHQGTKLIEAQNGTIGMGHTRLSIIEVGDGGNQPMQYKNWTIVYNGEIYNYQVLRQKLIDLGHTFKTKSDTEVILHAHEEWGMKAINQFIGMFAYTLFDRSSQKLALVRDRVGVKPLYTYWDGELLLFGSELKVFHEHPGFVKHLNTSALQGYMQSGYVPGDQCIYENTSKVHPGTYVVWDLDQQKMKVDKYWCTSMYYNKPIFDGDYQEAKKELHELLLDAFKYRMVSDVPVGVFLSGGYDSTAVTALLQSQMTDRLKTFTIGFESGNNEAPHAKQTAEYLGTDHASYICTEKEAQDIIPELPYFYDEPFGDSSAIPTTLVSRLARQSVTVALSADGGDELLAGYTSYSKFYDYFDHIKNIPIKSHESIGVILGILQKGIPNGRSSLKHKVNGLMQYFQEGKADPLTLFKAMKSTPNHILENCFLFPPRTFNDQNCTNHYKNSLDALLDLDYTSYLPDDILTKVDRATMSISLEAREPLLDHRILELVATFPHQFKLQGYNGKILLKDIVHQYVPSKMMNRPKTGFSLPIYHWLRKDLRFLVDEYLNQDILEVPGVWNVKYCTQQVKRFKEGRLHYTPFIWYLLMFQMWYVKWMK